MAVKIFFCYAREDEELLRKLKAHLRPLQRQGTIDIWYDRDISAGTEWEQEISEQLNIAQVILLLVSSDFMNSDYCYSNEMQQALERHERGEARVIPIILRHAHWKVTPLSKLQVLPTDAKPVKSWSDLDEAFFNVVDDIHKVIKELITNSITPPTTTLKRVIGEQPTQHPVLIPVAPVEITKPGSIKPLMNLPGTEPIIKLEDFTLIRTLEGHSKDVNCVTISADGQTLASGSDDQTIKVWNLHSGQLLHTLVAHSSWINSVAISANGQTLASESDDGTAIVWNLLTGQRQRSLKGHLGSVNSIAISADGQTVISCSFDKTIKVWNLHTAQLLNTLKGHSERVLSVAIGSNGQTLVSGSSDQTIKIWNLHTGQLLRTLTGHLGVVWSIGISSDGNMLVSGSSDKSIKIWEKG